MRVQKLDKSQRIVLTLAEAEEMRDALQDYLVMCSTMCGFDTEKERLETFVETLDELILKADAI